MPPKKKPTLDDLLEDDDPVVVVETKAKQKPPVGRQPKAVEKQVKTPREREKYENDPSDVGTDDYNWSLEDSSSDTAKALEAFMGKGDLRKQSELTEQQIVACALLLETAGKYKLVRIRSAVHHFLALRVSKDRGSRQEAVTAFTGLVENRKMNQQSEFANSLRRD